MKRTIMSGIVLGAVLLSGCNRPEADECRRAVENIRALYGVTDMPGQNSLENEVRKCQAGSTKKQVACALKATTVEALKACDFGPAREPSKK